MRRRKTVHAGGVRNEVAQKNEEEEREREKGRMGGGGEETREGERN